jgi:sirohydrochlorin cobaltochelatase
LDSSAPVLARCSHQRLGLFDEVRVGFWKESRTSRALDTLSNEGCHGRAGLRFHRLFHERSRRGKMGLSGPVSDVRGTNVRYTQPIGSHPALARVILERALEAGGKPGDALAVLGHGTPRNPESERNVYAQAERARALGPFSEVVTVFLDQEPSMGDVFAITKAETVVMVPLFVADGWHVGQTIPEDLALEGPETRRAGRRLRYAAPVGTHPSVVDVILGLAEPQISPTGNGHGVPEPRRRHLPIEGLGVGEGMPFWQFRIHRDEQGLILHPLAHNGRPIQGEQIALEDVPERCRFDALGRYRPLSGALTVRSGWYARFDDPQEVEPLLDDLYPLGPTHWLQWEDHALRTVPLDYVLERQAENTPSRAPQRRRARGCPPGPLRSNVRPGAALGGGLPQLRRRPVDVTAEDRVRTDPCPAPSPAASSSRSAEEAHSGRRSARTSPPSTGRFHSRHSMCPATKSGRSISHYVSGVAFLAMDNGVLRTAAQQLFPGGVNSPVRSFRSVGGSPIPVTRGEGAYVYDAEGNRYVDYVGAFGPLILGHAHASVVSAVQRAAALGTAFGALTPGEIDLGLRVSAPPGSSGCDS